MIGETTQRWVAVRVKSDHAFRNKHALDNGWKLDALNALRLINHINMAWIAVEIHIIKLTPDFPSEVSMHEDEMRAGFSLSFAALNRDSSIHGLGE
jgi:hypothetical protein